jgi:hypothetical protein
VVAAADRAAATVASTASGAAAGRDRASRLN